MCESIRERHAVILAGGLGTRLRPFTEIIPKPLLPLGESSVMEIQIEQLKTYGFRNITIATNYKADYVEAYLGDGSKYGVSISFSRENLPLGTCGPLSLIKDQLKNNFILMNGDILTKLDFNNFMKFHEDSNAVLTLATKQVTLPFRFGTVSTNERGLVNKIVEKPDFKFDILAGIYAINPVVLDHIPENQFYNMDLFIKKLLEMSLPVYEYKIDEYWLDIGQVNDYDTARSEYNENFVNNND